MLCPTEKGLYGRVACVFCKNWSLCRTVGNADSRGAYWNKGGDIKMRALGAIYVCPA